MTEAKSKILARRARFLAAAAASAGIVACSSADDGTPTPADTGTSVDAMKTDGLADDIGADTSPMPCLTPVEDTGALDSADSADDTTKPDAAEDTGPMPCLAPPPGDAG
jgi:hypothetical protein